MSKYIGGGKKIFDQNKEHSDYIVLSQDLPSHVTKIILTSTSL